MYTNIIKMRRHSEQMADQRFLDIMHTSTSSNSNINQLSDTQTTTATTVSVSSHTHHHLHDNSGGHSCENNDDREMVLDEGITRWSDSYTAFLLKRWKQKNPRMVYLLKARLPDHRRRQQQQQLVCADPALLRLAALVVRQRAQE